MDIPAKLTELIPQSLQIYAVCGFGIYFLWNNYFSERAFWDNKKRELEVIKLAVEIDGDRPETSALKELAITDLKRTIDGRVERNRKMKNAVVETFKEGTGHFRNSARLSQFCIIGCASALVVTLGIWAYMIAASGWSPSERTTVLWLGVLSAIFDVPFGGIAGAFFSFGKKSGACLAGTIGCCIAAPFGINLIVAMSKLHIIPLRIAGS